ncbi:hypothetical protein [Endozoicomonas sp. ALC066]|uniref:hypothetical protein n=1 Tax=Endozoicomonas sp. ALC066 TaxID=3403078 RepID=UPI003BB56FAD
MNHYIVTVRTRMGEITKTTDLLVRAEDEEAAGDFAVYCEAHDPENLDWAEGGAYDLGGEFHLSARNIRRVSKYDFDILERYLVSLNHYAPYIEESGNYLKWVEGGRK